MKALFFKQQISGSTYFGRTMFYLISFFVLAVSIDIASSNYDIELGDYQPYTAIIGGLILFFLAWLMLAALASRVYTLGMGWFHTAAFTLCIVGMFAVVELRRTNEDERLLTIFGFFTLVSFGYHLLLTLKNAPKPEDVSPL